MKNYVVIDFETTGLDYKTEQITEVALIKYDEQFNEIGSYNTIVQLEDGKELSEYIKKLTGLTKEFLSHGIKEVKAFLAIREFVDRDTIVVAQYAPFDLAFLAKWGIKPDRYICTKSLTAQAEPNESSSLKPTCERLGIKLDNAHRAFADVRATAEVLKHRLSQPEIQFVENYIVKSPDRDLTFVPYGTIAVLEKSQFIKEEN